MWKYRSSVIFIAAMAFALKTAFYGDPISLTAMMVFLGCHYCDRFFGAERVELKVEAKLKAYEVEYKTEVENLKAMVTRIGLTMGIRGGNK